MYIFFLFRFVRYGIYNPRISNHFPRIINPCILFTNPFSLLTNWFPMICVTRPHSVISLVIRSLKLTFRSFTLLIHFHALVVCSPFYWFIPVDFEQAIRYNLVWGSFRLIKYILIDCSVNVSQLYTKQSMNDTIVIICLFGGILCLTPLSTLF